MSHPRILIFSPCFGPWPAWLRCFLESCRWNPSIDWLLVGDPETPEDLPPNVRHFRLSFADFRARMTARLGVDAQWPNAYKVCDAKPLLAALFEEEIADYDFWGYCDLDVIFGDIRSVYTPEIFSHDVISTHEDIVCGHFALLRNTPRLVNAFRSVPFWRRLLENPENKSFDEQIFSRLFLPFPMKRAWRRLITPYLGGGLFIERYSTNIAPRPWIDGSTDWPTEWYWRQGRLTNNRTGAREFLYLHFSNWQSNRWTAEGVAPWKKVERLIDLPPGRPDAFTISAKGFTPLSERL